MQHASKIVVLSLIFIVQFVQSSYAQDSVDVTFSYKSVGSSPSTVSVPGEFNNWNIYSDFMTYDSESQQWYMTKRLRIGGPDPLPNPGKSIPGAYQYKFNLNSTNWITDPLNPRNNPKDNANSYLYINDPTIHYLLPNSVSGLVNSRRPQISAYIFPSTTSIVDTGSIKLKIDDVVYENIGSGYNPTSHLFTFTPPTLLSLGDHTLSIYAESSSGTNSSDSTFFTIFFDEESFIQFLTRNNNRYLRSNLQITGQTAEPDLSVKLVHLGVDSVQILSDSTGIFTAEFSLLDGENIFKAFAMDSANVEQETELLTINYFIDHAPKPTINLSTDQKKIYFIGIGNDPDQDPVTYQWSSDDEINPEALNISSQQASFSIDIPATAGEYFIDLLATDPSENTGKSRTFFTVNTDGSAKVSNVNSNTAWIQDALIYEIFVLTFTDEGTLAAAEEKLDYVKSLGTTTIYLMPIFQTTNVIGGLGAGYDITDFYSVHWQYGTLSDLQSFISRAHSLDMQVILDITPNHSAEKHPFMQDVSLFRDYSNYRAMYETDLLGDSRDLGQFKAVVDGYTLYVHYSNWTLPNFNYNNLETRDYMINMFKYWLLDVDVDGYRLDVYWGPNNRYGKTTWWRPFREELKRVKPEALLLGETDGTGFGSENNYADGGGALDAANDWSFYGQIKSAMSGGNLNDLDNRVRNYSPNLRYNHNTGENAHYFRFLENHDETRIAELYPISKTKVGAALLYTIPGLPMIYAGQEVGETSRRGPVNWLREGAQELTEYYKKLGEIRTTFPTFYTDLIQRESSGSNSLYAYLRPYLDQNALAVHNFSSNNVTATISITESDLFLSDSLHSDKTYYMNDVLNNDVYPVTKAELENFQPLIPAWNSAVFILADSVLDIIDDIKQLSTKNIPKKFALQQNYPNPFNPITTISFSLPKPASVSLLIFDVLGQVVYNQDLKEKMPGEYAVTWDGINQQGRKVGSGIYFYKVIARGKDQDVWSASRKMILIR